MKGQSTQERNYMLRLDISRLPKSQATELLHGSEGTKTSLLTYLRTKRLDWKNGRANEGCSGMREHSLPPFVSILDGVQRRGMSNGNLFKRRKKKRKNKKINSGLQNKSIMDRREVYRQGV